MSLDKNTIIKVTNRDNGSVGYTIPDLGNLHRKFESGETKEITYEELQKLSYISGGAYMLENFLVIDNEEAVAQLFNKEVEPEYYYTEDTIKTLLLEGTLAQLEDCLEFGPEGTTNLVKKLAVELKINDIAKRKAILAATGFNVTNAIEINEASEEDAEEQEVKTRRSTPIATKTTEKSSSRRAAAVSNKYKVVSKEEE